MGMIKKYYPYALTIVVTTAITAWLMPTRVKTVEVEKIVERTVEVEKETENKVVDREINIKEGKDGTKDIKIIERERTVTDREKNIETDREKETVKKKDTTRPQKNWLLSTQINPMDLSDTAAISLQRRIIGPIFAGASTDTDLNIRLMISFEF